MGVQHLMVDTHAEGAVFAEGAITASSAQGATLTSVLRLIHTHLLTVDGVDGLVNQDIALRTGVVVGLGIKNHLNRTYSTLSSGTNRLLAMQITSGMRVWNTDIQTR